MSDAPDYRSLFRAAESAATGGDIVRAEALLCQGLRQQAAALGSAHPDLASTCNNLAIVCERTGRLDEAEGFYRRAHAIAGGAGSAYEALANEALGNLRDFCRAYGRPLDRVADSPADDPLAAFAPGPPEGPPAAAPPPAPVPTPLPRARRAPSSHTGAGPTPPTTRRPPDRPRERRPALIAAGAVLALGVVLLGWWGVGGTRGDAPTSATARPAGGVEPRPTEAAVPPTPAPPPSLPRPDGEATPTETPANATPAPADVAPAMPSTTGQAGLVARASEAGTSAASVAAPALSRAGDAATVAVRTAELCDQLETSGGTWRCRPAASPHRPGPITYYTRVASPSATTVRHRWSRDGRVLRTATLDIAANPSAGYRTFSRQTVSAGRWTVALVDAEGTVLHEAHLDVR
ncbi:MAG: DUF2914 domain-containing protein [Vicinamibacterales bacterium]